MHQQKQYVKQTISNATNAGYDVVALVESANDIRFWQWAFKKFIPKQKIYCTSKIHNKTIRGVQQALRYTPFCSARFVICIDSDFRYLNHDIRLQNQFIFHTYTHSVENYLCLPELLSQLIDEQRVGRYVDFNFKKFLSAFSEIVFQLFLYIHYSEMIRYQQAIQHKKVTPPIVKQAEINRTLCINMKSDEIANNGEKLLKRIAKRVNKLVEHLSAKHPDIDTNKMHNELFSEFGIIPGNTFLYLQGHLIYNCIIKNLLRILLPSSATRNYSITQTLQHLLFECNVVSNSVINQYRPLQLLKENMQNV